MPSTLQLRAAVHALAEGGVIACPTEAVWGLSCDPDNPQAVARLLQIKERPVEKGLILVAASMEQIAPLLAGITDAQRQKLALSWPGPTTWLIPHYGRVAPWVHGGRETVAVRVTAHAGMVALCSAWGGPVVSTSANPGGSRPALSLFQIHRYFRGMLDGVLPGPLGGALRPSVIRDLQTDQVLRS
ncbi:MAG: L-threonylcarbamoyladenylate synthase [Haliea sp.]|jgi:L-threonylcarbamoyladenylate synthase|nr:L-threonylcarbamoyladenylate synthase [Haliea sp.]